MWASTPLTLHPRHTGTGRRGAQIRGVHGSLAAAVKTMVDHGRQR